MTSDLGPCERHGLSVLKGVTLDCRGHAIKGAGSQSKHFGVSLRTGTIGTTVKACEVTGFFRGIRLRGAHKNRVIGNNAHGNGDPIKHAGYGIDLAGGSTENLFQDNLVHNNADEGIHVGTGSHRNRFVGNKVYDNFRENIYVLRSDGGRFENNVTWGGRANSLFLKHSAFHWFANNAFRDRTVLVRGDSHDNQFINNRFEGAGIHFQAYREGDKLTRPANNVVFGGTVTGAENCLRFSSASMNTVKNTALGECRVSVLSNGTEADAENSLIGVELDSEKLSLDDRSVIHVGWQLQVTVQNKEGGPVGGAEVRGFNLADLEVFNAVTDGEGKTPVLDVVAHTFRDSRRIFQTPHTLKITSGRRSTVQKLRMDGNRSLAIVIPSD